ncbi:folate-binding protein YgfZ [Thiocapsa imhoffii]|uniref:Folate-binding protein YgfZ n=1 Tax=Thiocapsa imhoffii TaxID=382777 RepID=A0A9X0WGX7_9GAMM|nr:folate-binding protein YgfZ [Thiocapsa imhoffii]MBK1643942.1 folate-binding protein YgfZ [Thiocapsa imhoffii]
MHPVWQEVLSASGAQFDENGRVRFPAPTLDQVDAAAGCRLFDLSALGLIAVQGEDAANFLQGQLTNDVRELSENHVQWSSHCSQKGRMLANFLVLRRGDTIYLQLSAELVPDLLKRLRMFVLRSRVTLEDASDRLARLGIAGDCVAAALTACALGMPERENGMTLTDEITVIRLSGPTPRVELIGPPEALRAHWQTLLEHAVTANSEDWTLLDIRAGIPLVHQQTVDAFVPQMTNMHLIDGVSFNKGCYTGQEVVARMQYLGKLKRRMYLAEVQSETPPQPGDALHSTASSSQQGSGAVVMASPVGPGRYELLVVVETNAVAANQVRLGEGGPLLTLTTPPYGFPSTEDS